ncbi:MAG: ribosomal RNA adenine dimethylase [Chitinophagales bacterium]|nr:ribosomal RNA adenine dimethylase [Chitinophagales bacterium]
MPSELLKTFKTSGAVAFSSHRLVRRIIRNINFKNAGCLIELGPGNGRITKELLRGMRSDAILYAFEVNKAFCIELAKIADPRLKVINKSASDIKEFVSSIKFPAKNYIISSIPFGILPETECEQIMRAIYYASDKHTTLIQFSYSLIQYRRFKKYFSKVKVQFEPINIPPAFVFVCKK